MVLLYKSAYKFLRTQNISVKNPWLEKGEKYWLASSFKKSLESDMKLSELLDKIREGINVSEDDLFKNEVNKKDNILDCYQRSRFYGNLLMIAVIHDNEDVAETLCKFDNDVNKLCRVRVSRDREYTLTALTVAVRFGKFKMVELLLRHGADPNIECDLTPLGVAVQTNSLDMVKLLVDAKADVNIATHPVENWKNRWRELFLFNEFAMFHVNDFIMQTPLHIAARLKHVIIYEYLIDKNAMENVLDGNKLLACDILRKADNRTQRRLIHEAILLWLAFYKESRSLRIPLFPYVLTLNRQSVNAVSCYTKRGLLHMACSSGQIDLVQYIMESGAYVDAVDKYGYSPLHLAVFCFQKNIVKFLVKKQNANINFNICDGSGDTMLHKVCRRFPHEIVQFSLNLKKCLFKYCDDTKIHRAVSLLIENGADVNLMNKNGETPLHLACQSGKISIIDLLLKNNARVDPVNEKGYTPLMVACQEKMGKVVRWLLKKGANVNWSAGSSRTLLRDARSNGMADIAELLIEYGAEINYKDTDQVSSLMLLAFQNNKSKLVCRLIKNGATIDDRLACATNEHRQCLLGMACETNNIDILHKLLSIGAKMNEGKNCFNKILAKNRYTTAKLLVRSRCYIPEKAELLKFLSMETIAGNDYERTEFSIWCFEELGYEMSHIYNHLFSLPTEIAEPEYHTELIKWMQKKMSEVPSLKAECRKNIKTCLSEISNNRSIFPAVDQLPLPKDMKLLLSKNLFGSDDPHAPSVLDIQNHEFVLHREMSPIDFGYISEYDFDSYPDDSYYTRLDSDDHHISTLYRLLRNWPPMNDYHYRYYKLRPIRDHLRDECVICSLDFDYRKCVKHTAEKELKRYSLKKLKCNNEDRFMQTVQHVQKYVCQNKKFKRH